MKAMVMILLLAAMPAMAQEGREATELENAWMKLGLLAQGAPADALSNAKAHGLGLTGLLALQRYLEESQERLTGLSRDFWKDVCANQAEYQADHQKFIQRWELYVQDKQSMKQSIIDGLPEIIGKETADAVLDFAAHSRKAMVGGFDTTDMRTNHAVREQVLYKTKGCEEQAAHAATGE